MEPVYLCSLVNSWGAPKPEWSEALAFTQRAVEDERAILPGVGTLGFISHLSLYLCVLVSFGCLTIMALDSESSPFSLLVKGSQHPCSRRENAREMRFCLLWLSLRTQDHFYWFLSFRDRSPWLAQVLEGGELEPSVWWEDCQNSTGALETTTQGRVAC